MKRKSIVFLPWLLVSQFVLAQNNYSNVAVPYNPPPPVYLRDVFTTRFEPKKYADVQGSPFLDDNWMLARLVVSRFKTVDSIYVRLNLYENQLHFLNEKKEELQATIDFEQIEIIDNNSKWYKAIFLHGAGRDRGAFFQLLADGSKMRLVKKLIVDKWETKSVGTEIQRRFEKDEKLFLLFNQELYKVNKSCSAIEPFKNEERVQQFISSNNLKCNREEDLAKLVAYFNSL